MKLPLIALVSFVVACSPSPEDVCDHVLTLAKSEVGDKAAEGALGNRDDCVKTETRRKERQGSVKYKENNACLMAAKTWKEANQCSK